MLLNSYTFVVFFALVLGMHYLPISWRIKKFNLLWASYIFYAAWNPPFVVLLWFSTIADWFFAKWMHSSQSERRRKLLLLGTLGVNLGLLGFFKYSMFALENFTALANWCGIDFHPAAHSIILPVGISFYTFQTLSYTLDVYRRKMAPCPSFLDYALYVTFFPQLVAGPIVRAADFLPQCAEPKKATSTQLGWGISLMILGLFEKTVIADGVMAPMVEAVYDQAQTPTFASAWVGTLAFASQIFCDFAGYSTCAIGAAMCFGFWLPTNFRFPYAAIGFSDFWRRWHISLSTWLRDYLFMPLEIATRHSMSPAWRTPINLVLTMLLGGLWHGASWNFVIWGGLHGTYLAGERMGKGLVGHWSMWNLKAIRLLCAAGTFLLICLTWVFFRAKSLAEATGVVGAMVGRVGGGEKVAVDGKEAAMVLVVTAVLLAAHWLLRDRNLEDVAERTPRWMRVLVLAGMLFAICVTPGEDRAFIYFQF